MKFLKVAVLFFGLAAAFAVPGAGRDLSRQRAGDRPFEPPPRGLCRRGAGRAGAEGSLDRLAGEVPHRAREAGHLAAGGLVGGLQEPHDARIHGLGRHALYRSRAGGGCRAAGGRDGPSVAVPRHGGESRKFEGDRPAGDREKPRLEPRRVAHRALVSRRGLLARGVSQRFDRAAGGGPAENKFYMDGSKSRTSIISPRGATAVR